MTIGQLTVNTSLVLAGMFAILVFATTVVAGLGWWQPGRDRSELVARMRSWWWIAIVFALIVELTRSGATALLAVVSFLALREYFSIIPTRHADRRVLLWAYAAIPLQFFWAGIEWYGMFIIFIPVYLFLLMPMRMVLIGKTGDFLRAAGTLHWGLMTCVFSLSHAAYLLALPAEMNPAGGSVGPLLYLVLLTALNDVAQYCWGKLLGRRKVAPSVSPGKTVAGLVGAVVTIAALAMLLGPWLTPLTLLESFGAGVLVSLAGFIGDVTISAIKRDLGIKDSGTLIPGHGGVLDRVDSLTYTAPLFFHYLYYLHY